MNGERLGRAACEGAPCREGEESHDERSNTVVWKDFAKTGQSLNHYTVEDINLYHQLSMLRIFMCKSKSGMDTE